MKGMLLILLAVLLSGCSATMVSYSGGRTSTGCPPVVQVHSFGSNVTITDGSECKKENKK